MLHDGDAVADAFDDAHVVADEEIGQTQLLLQFHQQVDHLRLDGNVEGRDGFIGNDQLGREAEGAGNAEPLALAAREFVWIAVQMLVLEADAADQFHGAVAQRATLVDIMDDQRLDDLLEGVEARIERGIGVLENDLHVAPHGAHLSLVKLQDIATLEPHFSGMRLGEAQDGTTGGGFARAGFAHQRQRLAATDREAHIVDGFDVADMALEHALVDGEPGREVFYLQKCIARGELALIALGIGAERRRSIAAGHGTKTRNGIEQTAGIHMVRFGKELTNRLFLNPYTFTHDDDTVGHFGDHAHVMCDEQQRHAVFARQLAHQVEHLGLDGHVERGGRFVGDQEARRTSQRHGDDDALAHTARQLVRILVEAARGIGDAHPSDEIERLGVGCFAVHAAMLA